MYQQRALFPNVFVLFAQKNPCMFAIYNRLPKSIYKLMHKSI